MQSQDKVDIKNHISTQGRVDIYAQGQHKITCPSCQNERKKNKSDRPLSVNVNDETIVYHCHHCGINGAMPRLNKGVEMTVLKSEVKKNIIKVPSSKLDGSSADWLVARGISPELAVNRGCILSKKNNKPVIGFSFSLGDKVEAVKWRTANGTKDFWWENNAQLLWGKQFRDESLPDLESTIIITEGEMDCLAISQSFNGHFNIKCFSVPNGAPSKLKNSKVDPSEDGRFAYVWREKSKFENVTRIILATDSDQSGNALADELARRLNKARCYRVDYNGKKDANDLLLSDGEEAVRSAVMYAKPIPLHGLNNINYYADELQNLYDKGKPTGVTTGIASVDELFTIKTGMLNIITGYPSEGKSCFVDQLVINLARLHGFKTCFCSFENPPSLHAIKLSQILIQKPFFSGYNQRMTQAEKDYAQDWIAEHILFQDYQDGGMATIEAILEKAQASVMRYGCRVLVIDPFNFIVTESKNKLETDMVSDMLSKVQLFCKQHDVLCFFVAHPTKPYNKDGKRSVVGGLEIAKSMSFFAKCDLGITVARGDDSVGIHVWKARWGIFGHRLGQTELSFDPVTGIYSQCAIIEDTYLHKQHEVGIQVLEKSNIGRAVVLDQHIIDNLFINHFFDEKQHAVCNKYLGVISKSGAFVSGSDPRKIFTGKYNSVASVPRSCILLGVQRAIKYGCGSEKENIFWKIMVNNPKKLSKKEVEVSVSCADALLDYWYISLQSPLSLFQQALSIPSQSPNLS